MATKYLDRLTQKQQKTATRDTILIMCDMLVSVLIAFLWAWRVAPIGSSVFWNCYAAFFIGSVVNGLFTAVRKASVPLTEKHWAVRLFEEKEADFNRRHPEPIARVEFDGAEHGPYCPTADYACVCGLFDRQHAIAVLVEFLRKISATNARPVLERPA